MTDPEYLFYQETKSRKQMLSGARGRVNGSKSKKCTLPSDYLTRSQRKKLNGEVVSYNMNAPMTWEEFKKISKENQEAYLAALVNKYGVSYSHLGKMFGVSNTCVNHWVKVNNFTSVKVNPKGGRMTSDQMLEWSKFLHGEKKLTESSQETSRNLERFASVAEDVPEVPDTVVTDHIMQTSSISLSFDGEINFSDIVAYLKLAVGDSPVGHIEISFRKS